VGRLSGPPATCCHARYAAPRALAVSDDEAVAPDPEHADVPSFRLKFLDLLLQPGHDPHDAPDGATSASAFSPKQQEPHGGGATAVGGALQSQHTWRA